MSITVSPKSRSDVQGSKDGLVVMHQTAATVAEGKQPFMTEQSVTAKMRAVTLGEPSSGKLSLVVERYSDLRFANNKVVFSGQVDVSEISKYPNLTCLTLENCPAFTDADLDGITELVVNGLVELDLVHLPRITAVGLERMRQRITRHPDPLAIMKIAIVDSRITRWEGRTMPINDATRSDPDVSFFVSYGRVQDAVKAHILKNSQASPVLARRNLPSEIMNKKLEE